MLLTRAIAAAILLITVSIAQAGTEFDLSDSPDSPVFIVLDSAPQAVERPGNVADLVVSLQSATADFSLLPANYALTVSPYWLAGSGNLEYADYAAAGHPVWRTTTLSVAALTRETADGASMRSVGLGMRCSLVQGPVDPLFSGYAARMDSVRGVLEQLAPTIAAAVDARVEADAEIRSYQALIDSLASEPGADARRAAIEALAEAREEEIAAEVMTAIRGERAAELDRLQGLARSLRVRRHGFNVDFAMAGSWDFPGDQWDAGHPRKLGAWMTASQQGGDIVLAGVARWLHDHATDGDLLDMGASVTASGRRFSCASEAVLRHELDHGRPDTWRYDVSLDYGYAANRSLRFTVGKDFDGAPHGNLLTVLSLVIGFGAERPFVVP